jgi:hypothetical protein
MRPHRAVHRLAGARLASGSASSPPTVAAAAAAHASPPPRLALLFPGQGAQRPGMGKSLHDGFVQARHVFQEVDEALQENLGRTLFSGTMVRAHTRPMMSISRPHTLTPTPHFPPQTSQAELSRTAVTQPALLAHSIAVYRVLEVRCDPRTRSPRPSRPFLHIPPLPPFLPSPPHPSPSSATRPSKEPCAASLATRWGSTRPSLRPAPSPSRTRPGSSVCAATACSGRRTRRRR